MAEGALIRFPLALGRCLTTRLRFWVRRSFCRLRANSTREEDGNRNWSRYPSWPGRNEPEPSLHELRADVMRCDAMRGISSRAIRGSGVREICQSGRTAALRHRTYTAICAGFAIGSGGTAGVHLARGRRSPVSLSGILGTVGALAGLGLLRV